MKDMIKIYNKKGKEKYIDRERWRRKILPGMLKKSWNSSDSLYNDIVMALQDGFAEDVLKASERLLQIDENRERSHVIRAITLMKNGYLDNAEQILNSFVNKHGETGCVLTNLAKVYAEKKLEQKAEETLWKGLNLDPNQDNALEWWGAIQEEKGRGINFYEAMAQISKINGSWCPQLWIARECLENNKINKAKEYYKYVIDIAKDENDVLMMISGDLGKNGYIKEVLDIVSPVYNPKKHGPEAGINILQACLETGNFEDGMQLLKKMYRLNRYNLLERLRYYESKFNELENNVRNNQK